MGMGPETEFDRQLRERIEAGLRRVAEARERGGLGPAESGPIVEARRRQYMEEMRRLWREAKMRRKNFR